MNVDQISTIFIVYEWQLVLLKVLKRVSIGKIWQNLFLSKIYVRVVHKTIKIWLLLWLASMKKKKLKFYWTLKHYTRRER